MKRSNILIAVVVAVVVIGGGYAIFHKSSKPKAASTASQSTVPAVNNSVIITKTAASVGQYLADPTGKALYTYNADTSGVSNCTGACLSNWPAYQDTGATTGLPTGISTIKRVDNGQTQYTYNGLPLYYFSSDGSGQVTGNGVDNFSAAKPAAASSSSSSSNSSNSSSSSSSAPAASSSSSSPNYNY